MKIKVDKKTFAQTLAEVAPFAPSKPAIMVLKNAKFTTKGNRMKIEAHDTENSMVKYITLNECDGDGSFLMDIAELNKFVAKVPDGELSIDIDDGILHITHAKGSAEFTTLDADEYPVFNMPENETSDITIPASMLGDAISKAKGYVSTETLRPMMCAIYAYVKNGSFGYCATDTHKLIHGHQAYDLPVTADVHWLIMPTAFASLLNLCKSNDMVTVKITDTHASYRIGSNIIQTVLAKGNYPQFERVIPKEWAMECAVDKLAMLDALSRISMFCDSSECVKMNVSPMDMTLTVDNVMYNKYANENIAHNGCNGEITIGMNVGNVMECVRTFGNGDVLLRMSDPSRPVVFAQADNEGLISVAMPMTIVNG